MSNEINAYQDVIFLTQGKNAVHADVLTSTEPGNPRIDFRFTITRGQIPMQEGKFYIVDMLRHYDVLSDGIQSSRN